jgi:hypothetical protein
LKLHPSAIIKIAAAIDPQQLGIIRVSKLVSAIWEYSLESKGEVQESRIEEIFKQVADPDKIEVQKLLALLLKS